LLNAKNLLHNFLRQTYRIWSVIWKIAYFERTKLCTFFD